MTKLTMRAEPLAWPMREPFAIARGVQLETLSVLVTLTDEAGIAGRGEGYGVNYAGETQATMLAQLDQVRRVVETGVDRSVLRQLLPAGGARFALDSALWDLEARRSGIPAWEAAGLGALKSVTTAYTIGIRDIDAYRIAARTWANFGLLKVKTDGHDPLAAVRAVREGAPNAALIVDPNQSWSVAMVQDLAPALLEPGVVLLEQPIPVGAEQELDGYRCPIPLAADELINDQGDLAKARGRFDVINIKLDKAGGLTEALRLADAAEAAGFRLMVGCMAGSSLAMAPAFLLAQRCDFVDLDGPLLQAEDWPGGLVYRDGEIDGIPAGFWGSPAAVEVGVPDVRIRR